MKAYLIINPNSGPKSTIRELDEAINILEEKDYIVEKLISNTSNEARKFTLKAVEEKVDIVIAAGGDGTINEICNTLANTNIPLAIIPTGTANVLANELGIPTRKVLESNYIIKSINIILNGQNKVIDLGKVTFQDNKSKYFAMWCGVGIDAKLTEAKPTPPASLSGRILNYFKWFRKSLKILIYFSGSDSKITIDKKEKSLKLYQALISNGSLYANYFSVSEKAKLDDGLLDVFLFKDDKKRSRVALFLKSLASRHLESNTDLYQAKKISIKSKVPLPVHVDAETCGTTPVIIEVIPSALRIIVPK